MDNNYFHDKVQYEPPNVINEIHRPVQVFIMQSSYGLHLNTVNTWFVYIFVLNTWCVYLNLRHQNIL